MEEENYIKEKNLKNQPKAISIQQIDIIKLKAIQNTCKIHCGEGTGTGFFCNIPNGSNSWNSLKVLMTNNHVLNKNDISIGKKVKFSLNNEKNFYEIIIDKFRKVYSETKYDLTIIELKEEDKLDKISFFDIDDRIFQEDFKELFINETIILLHYPEGNELKYSDGALINIGDNDFTIKHSCDSSPGSSGGPIINLIDFRVIGIHKGGHSYQNYNLGTFLKVPLEEFINPQQTKKKEYKNIIEDSKSTISIFDKIFLFYAPEVNSNSIKFHSPFCCCFSLSIEKQIIIHFLIFAFSCLSFTGRPSKLGLIFFLLAFLSPIFLFISNKNHNYWFARLSFYFSEIIGLRFIYLIKEILKGLKEGIFEELEDYCKGDDSDSCFLMFIGLCIGLILGLLFLYEIFYFIYLSYYQLSLIKYKNDKKLKN